MATLAPKSRMTYREYLAFENDHPERHEFVDGQLFAMTGATPDHNIIEMNLAFELGAALRRGGSPCRLYSSSQRVRVGDQCFYPDLKVVCGPREPHPDDPLAIVNPSVIFEVLSPTTEAWDRGGKFEALAALPGLRYYVLIRQDKRSIFVHERQDSAWRLTLLGGEDRLRLELLGLDVPVGLLYAGTGEGA